MLLCGDVERLNGVLFEFDEYVAVKEAEKVKKKMIGYDSGCDIKQVINKSQF